MSFFLIYINTFSMCPPRSILSVLLALLCFPGGWSLCTAASWLLVGLGQWQAPEEVTRVRGGYLSFPFPVCVTAVWAVGTSLYHCTPVRQPRFQVWLWAMVPSPPPCLFRPTGQDALPSFLGSLQPARISVHSPSLSSFNCAFWAYHLLLA